MDFAERVKVSDDIVWVGADDADLEIFESQYPVEGISYNSYVILDEKITIMDTVDRRGTAQFFDNLAKVLGDNKPSYLIVQHMEPDHAANVGKLAEMYPEMVLVGSMQTQQMLPKYFDEDLFGRFQTVKEGETLSLGRHTLQFVMAPMVHWPEVMVSYEQTEKVLFSADGFGTFGALENNKEWIADASHYYFNIVGKYGAQVQALLKKASALDIQTIAPLHGPVHKDDIDRRFSRGQHLHDIDEKMELRYSHENPDIKKLYEEFLGEPVGELSEQLLHTNHFGWKMPNEE